MEGSKSGMTTPKEPVREGLAGTLIGMLAVGVAGGALLISGAKLVGEKLLDAQVRKYEELERRREADKEEVRRITSNDIEK